MEVGEFDEPEELKFHIDDKITKAIEEAYQVHKNLVGYSFLFFRNLLRYSSK